MTQSLKQPDPTQDLVRRARRTRRLGPDAICLSCGETDTAALTMVSRSLLEAHHVCGAANDRRLTVPLCLNCHRKITERLEVAGVAMSEPRDLLEMLVMIFRALADFFRLLAERFLDWSERLASLIAAQDAAYPSWRNLPESQA